MPIPYDATNLKSRFQTGDKPTQQDYADLIDTMFHYLSDHGNRIVALEGQVAALSNLTGLAKVFVTVKAQVNPGAAIDDQYGVDSVQNGGQVGANDDPDTLRNLRINFTNPFADNKYTVVAYASGGQVPTVLTKNASFIDLQMNETFKLSLALFDV
jgi:hypothetical protein